MTTRRIRRDEHGIYIRLDGSLFRPQVTADSRRYDPTVNDTVSRFRKGDYVYAHLSALRMRAAGLSPNDIAAQLGISERTVHRIVSRSCA